MLKNGPSMTEYRCRLRLTSDCRCRLKVKNLNNNGDKIIDNRDILLITKNNKNKKWPFNDRLGIQTKNDNFNCQAFCMFCSATDRTTAVINSSTKGVLIRLKEFFFSIE